MNCNYIETEDLLNQAQKKAVKHDLGNILVIAGAGSGKTRVLVHRVAWLLAELQTDPSNMMIVTFTNKAAKEMCYRLNKMNLADINRGWIGTFHGLAHKFLRLHYNLAFLDHKFEVIDSEDQLKILRRLIKQLNLNEDLFEPKKVQNFINRQKDHGVRSFNLPMVQTKYDKTMFEIYTKYEEACRSQHSVDFAELLLKSYEVLRDNPELLQHYQARFKHFLIDEFQDTNPIQYNFLKLLASNALSVTAVGDDDQSIYSWRGAKVENIVKYTKEFKEVKVIRLEKNYRSTKTILAAANSIITNNFDRMGKTLWTDDVEGEKITIYGASSEGDEASFIVQQILKYLSIHPESTYEDIAILYRSNAQSRAIEEALFKNSINYVIYGGVNFFERAEIKDLLAYLRLAINEEDNLSFDRIINTPVRGIGEKTLQSIYDLSNQEQLSYLSATRALIAAHETNPKCSKLINFIKVIDQIKLFLEDQNLCLSDVVTKTIEVSGLLDYLKKQKDVSSLNRLENLQELVNASIVFDSSTDQLTDLELTSAVDSYNHKSKIMALLDYAALEGKEYTKVDPIKGKNEESSKVSVKLMTLHSAKGLEFPIVFLCGLEEGLFPHYFSKDNQDSLNEERRLCYVGITRAMKKIFITYAKKRRLFGREEFRTPSRFLHEIPQNLIQAYKNELNYINPNINQNFKSNNAAIYPKTTKLQPHKCNVPKKVNHPKFGIGTIIQQDGVGDQIRVYIDFGVKGCKWLLLSYANMEVLN